MQSFETTSFFLVRLFIHRKYTECLLHDRPWARFQSTMLKRQNPTFMELKISPKNNKLWYNHLWLHTRRAKTSLTQQDGTRKLQEEFIVKINNDFLITHLVLSSRYHSKHSLLSSWPFYDRWSYYPYLIAEDTKTSTLCKVLVNNLLMIVIIAGFPVVSPQIQFTSIFHEVNATTR